jgi:hypothetical protein
MSEIEWVQGGSAGPGMFRLARDSRSGGEVDVLLLVDKKSPVRAGVGFVGSPFLSQTAKSAFTLP